MFRRVGVGWGGENTECVFVDGEEVGQEAVRGEAPEFDLGKGGLKYGFGIF